MPADGGGKVEIHNHGSSQVQARQENGITFIEVMDAMEARMVGRIADGQSPLTPFVRRPLRG